MSRVQENTFAYIYPKKVFVSVRKENLSSTLLGSEVGGLQIKLIARERSEFTYTYMWECSVMSNRVVVGIRAFYTYILSREKGKREKRLL